MRLFRPLFLVAALTALTACSLGDPFVDREKTFQITNPGWGKPKLAGYDGVVNVCYGDDTTPATRDALAAEACAEWGLSARLIVRRLWQCRLTVPHLAIYSCIDPAMRNENGYYINPFNAAQVDQWQRAHSTAAPAPAPAPVPPPEP
ncbi:hypothetical protein [Magnetospirillum fulvum]|uniref:Lipoprotein n=1 Tax=Magnetospirillum fulvum TaxID=1082 RepID=A0A1H6ID05_MAGFU|nr:hypothetical protein [Magnetospirillum fulvum]SEH45700.1 hypothetical protein SAMN04244559_02431 [Magnetospirillum fulvum]